MILTPRAMTTDSPTATFETVVQTVDRATERSLHILHLDAAEALSQYSHRLPASFACLIAWDDSVQQDAAAIVRLADSLLRGGAAYVCTWGLHCERVHDIFDEVLVGISLESGELSGVMTTWHTEDSLDEVLFYLLNCAYVDDSYQPAIVANVAIVIGIGNAQWTTRIRQVFLDPRILTI
jgi:hypothetical protein